jgi:hypothetical protein
MDKWYQVNETELNTYNADMNKWYQVNEAELNTYNADMNKWYQVNEAELNTYQQNRYPVKRLSGTKNVQSR